MVLCKPRKRHTAKLVEICTTEYEELVNSFPASGKFCHLLITFVNSLDPDQARQKERFLVDF